MGKISLAIALFCAALSGYAQTITGSITGTITDKSGAMVPNANITAVNTGTNVNYTTKTNAAGVYNLLYLPSGDYSVTADAAGFKKASSQGIHLEVNQITRLDFSMEVGQITETIEVTSTAPLLQTESAQTGAEISSRQARDLPLNGRNFQALALLVPGVITPNPGSFTSPARQFSGGRPYVNGNREQTNNVLLDGIDINEPIDNLVAYNPNVDALQELQVLTGNASAEFGNGTGAIMNMTTKSGTNEFHGNAFEFLQSDSLDANSFFNNRNGAKIQSQQYNIFGGTFGGPIKKDKLFFFMDYQGTRQRTKGPASASVATEALRNGDLSVYTTAVIDPTTGKPFPGNQIPVNRIVNPVAKALFSNSSLYPLPNHSGSGVLKLSGNYLSSSGSQINNDQADAKVDYRLNETNSLSGRFTIDRYASQTSKVVLPTSLGNSSPAPTTSAVLSWIHTFSPSMVNEARVGYTRVGVDSHTIDLAGVLGKNGNATLGISGGQPIAGASSVTISSDLSGIGSSATDSSEVDNDFHYTDTLTHQVGRHSIKYGFNFIHYQENRFYAGNNGLLGNFVYDGTYTGNTYADFLLDLLHSKGRGSQTGKWGHRQWRGGVFVQDDFKMRSNLTLNLGLRWEYTQPVYEVKDRQANVNLQTGQEEFAGKDGNSRALYKPYYKQFMPRVGFAYTPGMLGGRFVVRGGYGITSYMEGTGANLRLPLNPPFFFESAVTYGLTAPGSITTGFSDVKPLSTLSGQVRAWNPDLRPAFIQQWNLTTEYLLSHDFSLDIGYVGQRGTHLVDPREYNQPLPGAGPFSTWAPFTTRRRLYAFNPLITNISGTDSSATMSYQSAQVSARKRYSHGLEFLASYTLSKTLTDNLGYYGSGGVASEGAYWQNAYNRRADYGLAFFDALHNFSFSGSYELPYGKGRAYGSDAPRFVDLILGGWKADYIISAHSGFPVTINGKDESNQATRGAARPNRYKNLNESGQNIDHWFGTGNTFCLTPGVNDGTCAYGNPALGAFGSAGVGSERAPDFKNFDLAVEKQFHITERQYFDFRTDFYNAFNHPNFGPPTRSILNPATFGAIGSTVGSARVIQFGFKYYF